MNTKKPVYLNVHSIKSIPASNVNRNDLGMPKTFTFGGKRRGVMTSQCRKRSVREYFNDTYGDENTGIRTREIESAVFDVVKERYPECDMDSMKKCTNELLCDIKLSGHSTSSDKEVKNKSEALFFISKMEISGLADAVVDYYNEKIAVEEPISDNKNEKEKYEKKINEIRVKHAKLAKEMVTKNLSFDIYAFGRMSASENAYHIDGASCFSPMVSTHGVEIERDSYVGKDEYKKNSNGGGMMGDMYIDSYTGYAYDNLNLTELLADGFTKEEIANIVTCFLEAEYRSTPTGKIHSYNQNVYPDMMYVTISNYNINYISAFEKPLTLADYDDGGFTKKSIDKLATYIKKTYEDTGDDYPKHSWQIGTDVSVLGKKTTLRNLKTEIHDAVLKSLEER